MSNDDLIDTINRYISKTESYANCRKLKKVHPKFVKKQNILENDLRKVTKLQKMSLDDLKKIAILRKIKKNDKLSREDLVYTLLRSQRDLTASNFEKYITNDTNDEIKGKINNIIITLSRLGNIVIKNERKKIKKDLYEIEKKRLTKTQKERTYGYLIELANVLIKK